MYRKLLYTILLSLLGCILISYPLWLNVRLIPILPVFEWIVLTGFLHWIFLGVWGVLFLCLFTKHSTSVYPLTLFLIFLLILALQDQLRLQPWFYLFGILLIFLLAYKLKPTKQSILEDTFRIAIIGVYIWSGIHKFNASFVENTAPNTFALDLGLWGYSIPVLETALGVGLIFGITRKASVIGLFGMHFFIFYHMISDSILYDLVILPWNIGMMVMLGLLFWHNKTYAIQINKWNFYKVSACVVFIFLPSLNFVGLWQSYPSFSLFSGKTDQAFLYVDNEFKSNFSTYTQDKFNIENKIYINKLSYAELKIPVPPEKQIYLDLFKTFCKDAEHDLQVIMETKEMTHLFSNKWDTHTFFCSDLESSS